MRIIRSLNRTLHQRDANNKRNVHENSRPT